MELKFLVEMYSTHSPSFNEHNIRRMVIDKLDEMLVDYNIDDQGNVYNIIPDTPLLCAHMDQVGFLPVKDIKLVDDIIFGDSNLGADDKNGVWIILSLIKEFSVVEDKEISFIFSTAEEAGGNIDKLLEEHKEEMKAIRYGLVFDRRNGTDIVGFNNDYCIEAFQDEVEKVGKEFGYKPALGTFSDCNNLSEYISCVNLSCGYYGAHTQLEYTKISELQTALRFGKKILETITTRYEPPEKTGISYYKYGLTNYMSGAYNYIEADEDFYYCSTCDDYFDERNTEINLFRERHCLLCGTPMETIPSDEFNEHYDATFNAEWEESEEEDYEEDEEEENEEEEDDDEYDDEYNIMEAEYISREVKMIPNVATTAATCASIEHMTETQRNLIERWGLDPDLIKQYNWKLH